MKLDKQTVLLAAIILAVILVLGGLIWVYGNSRYEEGRSEVYTRIAEGKFDRWFTQYFKLTPPKPHIATYTGQAIAKDSLALDSLQAALKDSTAVIQHLGTAWKAVIQDSSYYSIDDSISVTFRAVHEITVDPIRKLLHDVFTPEYLDLPYREHEKVILREPTFWDNLEMILLGSGIGALIVILVHAL